MCKCRIHLFCHSPGGTAYSNAFFGAGTGSIFLDDVQCTSSASQLLDCPSSPILTHNCQHSDDAGVGCEGWLKYVATMLKFKHMLQYFSVSYSSLHNWSGTTGAW